MSLINNTLNSQNNLNFSIDLHDRWINLDDPMILIHPSHKRFYTISDSLGVLLLVVCALGVIGNALNIIVFCHSSMRGTTYIYLRTLSISNFCFIIFNIPLTIQQWHPEMLVATYASTYFTAHVLFYIIVAFLYTSNLLSTLITVERFIAICHPMKSKFLHKVWVARILCLTSFFLSFAFVIPLCNDNNVDHFDNDLGYYIISTNIDFVSSNGMLAFTWCRNLLFRLIPCTASIILTIKIIIAFEKLKETRKNMLTATSYSRFQIDKQLYILLILTVTMFVLSCFSGTASSVMGIYGNLSSYTYFIMLAISLSIDRISYGLSFYLYLIFLSHFRKTFIKIFFSRAKMWQESSDVTNRMSTCKFAEENQ